VSERLVSLGEIVATHGLEGWLKANLFNPESSALASAREIFIELEGSRRSQALEASRRHKSQILIKLHGVDSIDAARAFIGGTLCVPEESLPVLQPGEYYHFQAVGLEVVDIQGNRLGTISRTWMAGGREIYVVTGGAKEYLIPAVKEIIEKIDFNAGQMIINPPQGLLDL
jgi:16S rRNA processing protein RimM